MDGLILWDEGLFDARAALLVKGRVEDWTFWLPHAPPLIGAVFAARVRAIQRPLGIAFLDDGAGGSLALPLKGAAKQIQEGQKLRVKIIRDAQGEKEPVAAFESFMDDCALGLLSAAPHPVQRLAAQNPSLPVWARDAYTAAQQPGLAAIASRHAHNDFQEWEQSIEELNAPGVNLPGGGRLWIEETAACVAVDVDGAHAAGAASSLAPPSHVAERINQAALQELPRQIRLRHLGGLIVVDLLKLPRDKFAALDAQAKAWAACMPDAAYGGLNRLGLLSFSLPKRGPSWNQARLGPHSVHYAAGACLRTCLRSPSSGPVVLEAGETLAVFLRPHLAKISAYLGRATEIAKGEGLDPLAWRVKTRA